MHRKEVVVLKYGLEIETSIQGLGVDGRCALILISIDKEYTAKPETKFFMVGRWIYCALFLLCVY